MGKLADSFKDVLGKYTHLESKKTRIKDLPIGSQFYVSEKILYYFKEIDPQQQQPTGEFILFLDLTSDDFYRNSGNYAKVKVYKVSNSDYMLILPMDTSNQLTSLSSVYNSKENTKNEQYYTELLERINNKTQGMNIRTIYAGSEANPNIKELNDKVFDDFLNRNYAKIAGRKFNRLEKELSQLNVNMDDFIVKKPVSQPNEIDIIFEDVILDDRVKKDFMEFSGINALKNGKNPHKFHQGVVLIGPPRTGKSELLVRAKKAFKLMAGASEEEDIVMEIKELQPYVGEGTRRGKEAFAETQKKAKQLQFYGLLFLDEAIKIIMDKAPLDKVEKGFYGDLLESLKSHIGNDKGKGVITIFAANPFNNRHVSETDCRKELDTALVNDGRLKMIYVGLPNIKNAAKLFRLYIKKFIKTKKDLTNSEYEELGNLAVKYDSNGGNIRFFCELYYHDKNLSPETKISFKEIRNEFAKYMKLRVGEKGFVLDDILKQEIENKIRTHMSSLYFYNNTIEQKYQRLFFNWIDSFKNNLIVSGYDKEVIIKEINLLIGFVSALFFYINTNYRSNESFFKFKESDEFNVLNSFFESLSSTNAVSEKQIKKHIESNFENYFTSANESQNKQNDNNNNNTEDIKLAKEEIKLIWNDKDTQQIMKAQYGFELLGVKDDASEKVIIPIWRILIKKYVAQGGDKYEFDQKTKITSKIGREFLTEILKKINNLDKDNIKQALANNYNWDKFKYFTNSN